MPALSDGFNSREEGLSSLLLMALLPGEEQVTPGTYVCFFTSVDRYCCERADASAIASASRGGSTLPTRTSTDQTTTQTMMGYELTARLKVQREGQERYDHLLQGTARRRQHDENM
jgi:hypothetical protein